MCDRPQELQSARSEDGTQERGSLSPGLRVLRGAEEESQCSSSSSKSVPRSGSEKVDLSLGLAGILGRDMWLSSGAA